MDEVDLRLLTLLSQGHSVARVSQLLDLTERTTERRIQRLRNVLGARTTLAMVVTAVRLGLID